MTKITCSETGCGNSGTSPEDFPRVVNRQGASRLVCRECIRNGLYVFCEDIDAFHPCGFWAVYAEDTNQYFTRPYAEENLYEDDEGCWWVCPPEPAPASLLEYCASPFREFRLNPKYRDRTLMFGVELELEHGGVSWEDLLRAREVIAPNNRGRQFITKEDGSLHNGLEICTMPFTLDDHKSGEFIDWRKLLAEAEDENFRPRSSCGMHVHINRQALSPMVLGKVLVLMNQQNTFMEAVIHAVAGRGDCDYAFASPKRLNDGHAPRTDKYERVNVKAETVEFRIFTASLSLHRIMYRIEFCHAVVRYCQQTGLKEFLSGKNFCAFVKSERKTYPYLYRCLVDVGYISLTVKESAALKRRSA